jgi:serine/threonine-protein kinase
VVALLDCGELTDGRPYLAMEWLEGRNLSEELAARGYLSAGEALALVEEVAGALAAAHRAGIIHRDLKAQNVMVLARAEGARIKLVDFGIARLLDTAPGEGMTTTGHVLGSPIAMAPEQLLGQEADARADIYALGVLLFQLLTGQLPFQAPTLQEMEELHLHAPIPRVSALAPVPPGVDAVVHRCLEKQPAARYPGVEDVVTALRRALEREDPSPGASRAAALYLELATNEDADDEVLDRVDALLGEARRLLAAEQLQLVADGAGFLLAVTALPPSPGEERQARRRLVEFGLALLRVLEAHRGEAPVRLALSLHSAEARVQAGGALASDELASPARWSRGHPGSGLAATAAALEGLEALQVLIPCLLNSR